MAETSGDRRVVNIGATAFQAYDLDGPLQPEISWLPVSFDRAAGQGCYVMRMQPGALTIPHEHPGVEDFLMLEGELIDSDGTVFRPGDFVSYAAGTRHYSGPRPAASSPSSSGAVCPALMLRQAQHEGLVLSLSKDAARLAG